MPAKRNVIGTYPYEITEEQDLTVLRFYPKKPDAQDPDSPVLVLRLTRQDKQSLISILSKH